MSAEQPVFDRMVKLWPVPARFSDEQIEQLTAAITAALRGRSRTKFSEQLFEVLTRKARSAISLFKPVLETQNAVDEQGHQLQRLIVETALAASRDFDEKPHCSPGGVHGGGDQVEGGSGRIPGVLGRKLPREVVRAIEGITVPSGHHGLLALHGLGTRHVTGALLLAALWWLQRRGWVRRAAAFVSRPSGATEGGAS